MYPLDHGMRPVTVSNITDANGDTVAVTVNAICQDERPNFEGIPAYDTDGTGVGTANPSVRAEIAGTRAAPSNGRVYHIYFTGDDGHGGSCTGQVKVNMPTSPSGTAIDGGPIFDSTLPNAACVVPF